MEITEYVSLAKYTTLQVGGPARYFCEVSTVEEFEQARQFAQQTAVPVLVIGEGSNLLVADEGYDGLVILNKITGRMYKEADDATTDVYVTFGSGEMLDSVIAETVDRELWGLENLSHIPGTVGATPIQNVGAYGVEVADRIVHVSAIHADTGEVKIFSHDECTFGYRDSFFKTLEGRKWFITSVTFALQVNSTPVLEYRDLKSLPENGQEVSQLKIRQTIISIRENKFPDWRVVGTAGSFFKNPIIARAQADTLLTQYPDLPTYPVSDTETKVSLGHILDKICDLRGVFHEKVGLYEQQALVLINHGDSAKEVKEFAAFVAQSVFEKTGITIEQEVTAV